MALPEPDARTRQRPTRHNSGRTRRRLTKLRVSQRLWPANDSLLRVVTGSLLLPGRDVDSSLRVAFLFGDARQRTFLFARVHAQGLANIFFLRGGQFTKGKTDSKTGVDARHSGTNLENNICK